MANSRERTFDPTALKRLIDERHAGNVAAAARHTGIAQPTLFNILGGKGYSPRADTLAKLAHAYGVSFDYISGRGGRAHDDSFVSGVHAAIRHVRQELDRLEASLQNGKIDPAQKLRPK